MDVVYSMKGAAGMDLACYHTAGRGQAQVLAASLHLLEEGSKCDLLYPGFLVCWSRFAF